MEQVLAQHPAVAECAVVGVKDALKGQKPLGLVVLKAGAVLDEETLAKELVALVREQIGAVAAYRDSVVVSALPKTRSGKILRKTMRQIIDGDDYVVPPTIDDPAAIDVIIEAAKRLG
jgi:propionyl-CoA synthetase